MTNPPDPSWSSSPFEPADHQPPPIQSPAEPKSRLFRIGLVMAAVGLVLGIGLGVFGATSFPDVDGFPRVGGDRQPVDLTAGGWTLFAEGTPVAGPTEVIGPDDSPVSIGPATGSQTYTIGGRSGTAVGKIEVPADGRYLVTTAPGGTIAFSQDFATSLVTAILSILAAAFLGGGLFLTGAILTLIGYFRNR